MNCCDGWRGGGEFETVFVDLEATADPADAVAEMGVRAKAVHRAFDRIKARFIEAAFQ